MKNLLSATILGLLAGKVPSAAANPYTWPHYKKTHRQAVDRFLEGRTFDDWNLGGIYERTPHAYAQKMGAAHGIFVNSGTAGLHASLMALGLQPGDRVIVPAMTFVRSVTPLVHLGLTPVVADIDPSTGNLDADKLAGIIDHRIKAVIAVHMWGVPCDMTKIREVAKRNKWRVIEDFSHAHFSAATDGVTGSFGDVAFASMQRKKTISVGEGGIVTTSNPEVFRRLQDITSPGSFNNTPGQLVDYSGYGLNMRMAPTATVLADAMFDDLDEIIGRRSQSAEVLRNLLAEYPEYFTIHDLPSYVKKVSWYALRIQSRIPLDQLKKAASGTRWRFGRYKYQAIADSAFWQKDRQYFPFSQGIQPIDERLLMGMKSYMTGRMSVSLPTWLASEWTPERIEEWRKDLVRIVSRLPKTEAARSI